MDIFKSIEYWLFKNNDDFIVIYILIVIYLYEFLCVILYFLRSNIQYKIFVKIVYYSKQKIYEFFFKKWDWYVLFK